LRTGFAGFRRAQRIIWRDDERGLGCDRKLVGRVLAIAERLAEAGAAAGGDNSAKGEGDAEK
jgi:hypothetical protein